MGDYLETHESYLVVTSRKQLAYQKLTKQLIKKLNIYFIILQTLPSTVSVSLSVRFLGGVVLKQYKQSKCCVYTPVTNHLQTSNTVTAIEKMLEKQ